MVEAPASREKWRWNTIYENGVIDILHVGHNPVGALTIEPYFNKEASQKSSVKTVICFFKVDLEDGCINFFGKNRMETFLCNRYHIQDISP